MHPPIQLLSEASFTEFTSRMQGRLDPKRFPYSSHTIDLQKASAESLEEFANKVGKYVRCLKFKKINETEAGMKLIGTKIKILISKTPQLTEIELQSGFGIYLSAEDIGVIPKKYPRLKTVDITYDTPYEAQPPSDSVPLLSILIERSESLTFLRFPAVISNEIMEPELGVLAALENNSRHSKTLKLKLDMTSIAGETETFFRKLMQLELKCREVHLDISQNNSSAMEIASAWLATPCGILSLYVLHSAHSAQHGFTLPPMASLEDLTLCYESEGDDGFRPFETITLDQFRSLTHLTVVDYRPEFGTFDQHSVLHSVKHLTFHHGLHRPSPAMMDPWHTILPNLTSVLLNTFNPSREIDEHNIRFVLAHFPGLTRLGLRLGCVSRDSEEDSEGEEEEGEQVEEEEAEEEQAEDDEEEDYWEVLTGGAPRPTSMDTLLREKIETIGDSAIPVKGIYPVPSLANMTGRNNIF